jgi:hypothetical protein
VHVVVELGEPVERISMEVAVEAVASKYIEASERLNLGLLTLLRVSEAPGALHEAKSFGTSQSQLD